MVQPRERHIIQKEREEVFVELICGNSLEGNQ
jgi:hypothetical protein